MGKERLAAANPGCLHLGEDSFAAGDVHELLEAILREGFHLDPVLCFLNLWQCIANCFRLSSWSSSRSVPRLATASKKAGSVNPPVEVPSAQEPSGTPPLDSGALAEVMDSAAGVVFHKDLGILEWTPPPFSRASGVKVLFLLTDSEGGEEIHVHTIERK